MKEFEKLFKALDITEPDLQKQMLEVGRVQTVPADSFIVEQEKYIKWLAIVVQGKVRVWQEHDDRQILLYYVNPIETCILSMAATFRDCKSVINAKTETESTIVKIPVHLIAEWSYRYPSWNKFAIRTFIESYEDLLHSFKNLAFNKIDKRLMNYLETVAEKSNSSVINLSHRELAEEIGTTREVVSKILKQFEISGLLKLAFKKIILKKNI